MWRVLIFSLALSTVVTQDTIDEFCRYKNRTCIHIGTDIRIVDEVVNWESCMKFCRDHISCTVATYEYTTLKCRLVNGRCLLSNLEDSSDTDTLIRSGDSDGICVSKADGWEDWSIWDSCTKPCGGGTQTRNRTCIQTDAGCMGNTNETQRCNLNACAVDGGWGEWTRLDECTVTCGGGNYTRIRACDNPAPTEGGENCVGDSQELQSCNSSPCPVDGGFSEWSDWGSCSVTCGRGEESRTRSCNNPAPNNGGENCQGSDRDVRKCEKASCPVDGTWGEWTVYDVCTVTCGGGNQTRTRLCDNPKPSHGGASCSGESSETQECNRNPCPVDGGFSPWSQWSTCTAICGSGTQKRARVCDSPAPDHGGSDCVGDKEQVLKCNEHRCPVNGGFSDWSTWSDCSASCGEGEKTRTRNCDNPPPSNDGADCNGPLEELTACKLVECPVNGDVSAWSEWSECSVTCGSGTEDRTRACDNPSPAHGGRDCDAILTDNQPCTRSTCPADGNWGSWTAWSDCSEPCGNGTQNRSRVCNNPSPSNGGLPCPGADSETHNCNDFACNEVGYYCSNDENGDPGTCLCPEGRCSSLEDRCDVPCASVGDPCKPNAVAPCWDEHAYCGFYGGGLIGIELCRCQFNYVAVSVHGQPTRCRPKMAVGMDRSGCQTCVENGGSCYDDDLDNLADGCVCPPTRATVIKECDTPLFGVHCDRTFMKICYRHHGIPEHVNTFTALDKQDSFIYIQDHFANLDCHLAKTGDDYCITLNFEVQPQCGLLKENLTNYLSYSTKITVQRHREFITNQDWGVYAFCRFDKMYLVASSGVEVVSYKGASTMGVYSEARVTMSVIDEIANDLTVTGIILGNPMKVVITLTDNADGVFTSIRADICLVTDHYSLTKPDIETLPLVVDGCPEKDGLLTSKQNFAPLNGSLSQIATGFFPSPKFSGSPYLFIHCGVRVCMNNNSCAPKTCSRRKRSLQTRAIAPVILRALSSPEYKHEVVAIMTRPVDPFQLEGGRSGGNHNIWMAAGVLAACVIVILVIALFSWYYVLRQKPNGYADIKRYDDSLACKGHVCCRANSPYITLRKST